MAMIFRYLNQNDDIEHHISSENEAEIRNIIYDRTFSGILQATSIHCHRFGLNCKLSGSVYAVSEIRGAIPIMHGPAGCAFHHRLTPMKIYSPSYNLPCTNLKENDVIYGGEEKLRNTIAEVHQCYQPSMIVVLPTCISGLIGDDIAGICEEKKSKIHCPLVYVSSEGFAHRSKESLDVLLADSAKAWKTSKPPDGKLRGCGQEDVILSLVDQLMEAQDVTEDLVNLEYFGRFRYGSKMDLQETQRLFGLMGIRVNAAIPSCTVEQIKLAPSAVLNIIFRNRRVAKRMNERFGTDYFYKWVTHFGFDGIERFYREVASKLGHEGDASCVIEQEKALALKNINKFYKYFKSHRCALSAQAFFFTPYIVEIISKDIRLPLSYLCINTQFLRNGYASEETIQLILKNMREFFENRELEIEIIADPTMNDICKIFKKVDFFLNDHIIPPMNQNENGCKIIDISSISHLLFGTSFREIADFARYLAGYLNKRTNANRRPIVSRLKYDPINYPMIDDPRCAGSRAMWSDMWALGSSIGD